MKNKDFITNFAHIFLNPVFISRRQWGGAASTDTAGVATVSDTNPSPKWQQDSTTATSSNARGPDSELLPVPPSLEIEVADVGNPKKFAMEDLESVLSESAVVSSRRAKSRPFSAGSWEMSRTLQWRIWGFRVLQVILSLGKKVD
ncbi:hypothetical protein C2S52_016661 [Perilla frutescens var. hirtella]|nr:hypothetical protein C2S52_016661 [Perilla frutescens var. hirtella]